MASFVSTSAAFGESDNSPSSLTLWYKQPAEKWVEALPVGNGRLGAMIFGGIAREHLQLNEDTLYAGGPYDPNNSEALAALPEVRRLIFDGKHAEAAKLVSRDEPAACIMIAQESHRVRLQAQPCGLIIGHHMLA